MQAEPKPRPVAAARLLLPVLFVVSVGVLAAAVLLPTPFRKPAGRPVDIVGGTDDLRFPLPDFAFTERSGKPVTKADLAGTVWVASFVFTRCTGPCPSVTATVARLQSELDLAHTPDLRLVTFTVDPGRDTAAELAKYADKFHADPARWLFLTGREADIHELLNKSFKIQAGPTTNPHPPAGQEFDHSTRLAVVDKAGNVRGYFDGYMGPNDPGGEHYLAKLAELKQLVARLRAE